MATSNETVSVGVINVSPCETAPKNSELQAHSVWRASVYLARHIGSILSPYIHGIPWTESSHASVPRLDALELGAASGLSGISLAVVLSKNNLKGHGVTVTLSDYPDPSILRSNINRNSFLIDPAVMMKVVGHVWGSTPPSGAGISRGQYDLIIAADVLWLRIQHENLLTTPKNHSRPTDSNLEIDPTIVIVSGLHTG